MHIAEQIIQDNNLQEGCHACELQAGFRLYSETCLGAIVSGEWDNSETAEVEYRLECAHCGAEYFE